MNERFIDKFIANTHSIATRKQHSSVRHSTTVFVITWAATTGIVPSHRFDASVSSSFDNWFGEIIVSKGAGHPLYRQKKWSKRSASDTSGWYICSKTSPSDNNCATHSVLSYHGIPITSRHLNRGNYSIFDQYFLQYCRHTQSDREREWQVDNRFNSIHTWSLPAITATVINRISLGDEIQMVPTPSHVRPDRHRSAGHVRRPLQTKPPRPRLVFGRRHGILSQKCRYRWLCGHSKAFSASPYVFHLNRF